MYQILDEQAGDGHDSPRSTAPPIEDGCICCGDTEDAHIQIVKEGAGTYLRLICDDCYEKMAAAEYENGYELAA